MPPARPVITFRVGCSLKVTSEAIADTPLTGPTCRPDDCGDRPTDVARKYYVRTARIPMTRRGSHGHATSYSAGMSTVSRTPRLFRDVDALVAAQGEVLGSSDWLTVDQEMVDQFAHATGDTQWIHVDPIRAATGPFGGTVAHGYLTLSLLPMLARQIWTVGGETMAVNAGTNKVRFTAPIPVGARIRLTSTVMSVRRMGGSVHLVLQEHVHLEGRDRPACTAETVTVVTF